MDFIKNMLAGVLASVVAIIGVAWIVIAVLGSICVPVAGIALVGDLINLWDVVEFI